MREGRVGELYFETLPEHSVEVMIPAAYTKTRKEVMDYINTHFDEKFQAILKSEYEKDYKLLLK